MKKLVFGLALVMLLLPLVSCGTTATGPGVERETPPMTAEEGEGLSVESWQISENWTYSQEAVWGDVMVGLESEQERGKIVKQYIATYSLSLREKELVYELSPDRMPGQAPAIHGSNVVWSSGAF